MHGLGGSERSEAAAASGSLTTSSVGALLKSNVLSAKQHLQMAERELRHRVPNGAHLAVGKTFEKTLRQVERLMSELGELNLP